MHGICHSDGPQVFHRSNATDHRMCGAEAGRLLPTSPEAVAAAQQRVAETEQRALALEALLARYRERFEPIPE